MTKYYCSASASAVFETSDQSPWVCAVRSASSNTCCVVYSACVIKWAELFVLKRKGS